MPQNVGLTLAFNGGPSAPAVNVPVVNGTAVISNVVVPNFKLWTLRAGNLFTLTVSESICGRAGLPAFVGTHVLHDSIVRAGD